MAGLYSYIYVRVSASKWGVALALLIVVCSKAESGKRNPCGSCRDACEIWNQQEMLMVGTIIQESGEEPPAVMMVDCWLKNIFINFLYQEYQKQLPVSKLPHV